MARNPVSPAPQTIPDDIPPGHAESQQEAEILNQLQAGYSEERDLAMQLIGRIQFAKGFSQFADVGALADLQRIKEHKLYRALSDKPIHLQDGKVLTVGTWEDFCTAIGLSRQKVDEDLQNLAALGEQALNSMNRVGLGYRDLRKLRRLPESDRLAIIHEVEVDTGDKDAIVSLIDDMAARHAGEKQALEKQVGDLQADLDAQRQIAEKKNKKIDDLTAELHKRELLPVDEQVAELVEQVQLETQAQIDYLLGLEAAVKATTELESPPQHLLNLLSQSIDRIHTALDELRARYRLADLAHEPHEDDWMREVGARGLDA